MTDHAGIISLGPTFARRIFAIIREAMRRWPSAPELQSTPPRASSIEKQPRVFQEILGVLRKCSMARIRVHDELSIGEMLSEKERIDRHDHDILVPMHNQRRMVDFAQHRKAIRLGNHAP